MSEPEEKRTFETDLPDGTHVKESPVDSNAEKFGTIATWFVCGLAGLVVATVTIALCVRLWEWIV